MDWRRTLLLLSWIASAPLALAHHSFASIYDSSRQMTLTGEVTEFRFVNPHPILIFRVDDNGTMRYWRAEMDNRFELAEIGVTAQTFKPGDRVVVTGDPGRNEPQILYMWRLDRPADGLRYEQIGGTPSINLPQERVGLEGIGATAE